MAGEPLTSRAETSREATSKEGAGATRVATSKVVGEETKGATNRTQGGETRAETSREDGETRVAMGLTQEAEVAAVSCSEE